MKYPYRVLIVVVGIAIAAGAYLWYSRTATLRPISDDMIQLDSPLPGAYVSSPLVIKGRARGSWFFEASFPVVLTDWDGKIIAQGTARAKSDWMTTEFVDFEATLTFTKPLGNNNRGSLILRKDNPSGLPEHEDSREITVYFK